MRLRKLAAGLLGAMVLVGICIGSYSLYDRGRPAPIPMKEELYDGITYRRIVRYLPRPMIAHVLVIDTKATGIGFLVTPPDSEGGMPLKARTTSQFLEEFDLQIAVNGSGFAPWWSRGPADYYPHVGDPVAPLGFTASDGDVYWTEDNSEGTLPALYISRRNDLTFNNKPSRVHSALSGNRMIVVKGEVAPDLDDPNREPRTAVGTNRNGRYVYLVVVDGRQPFYSEGATFTELARLLIDQGAYMAMSLDGGGSSTLVIEGDDGAPRVLNSPIQNLIPGTERPVGTHLGIYVR